MDWCCPRGKDLFVLAEQVRRPSGMGTKCSKKARMLSTHVFQYGGPISRNSEGLSKVNELE